MNDDNQMIQISRGGLKRAIADALDELVKPVVFELEMVKQELQSVEGDRIRNIHDWLNVGIANDYCSEIYCQTHDLPPLSPEESAQLEEDGELCVFAVKVNTEGK